MCVWIHDTSPEIYQSVTEILNDLCGWDLTPDAVLGCYKAMPQLGDS